MVFKTKYPNCRHNFGRIRPVATFLGLGEENTFLGGRIFVFIICLFLKIFLSTTEFGEALKRFGVTAPECPPCLRAWTEPSPKVFHRAPSCLCRGARHSENVYLFHNMNSICRLCKLIINIFPQIPIIGS